MPMIPPVASMRIEPRSNFVRRRVRAGIIPSGCSRPIDGEDDTAGGPWRAAPSGAEWSCHDLMDT
jgi:hypothetical protein